MTYCLCGSPARMATLTLERFPSRRHANLSKLVILARNQLLVFVTTRLGKLDYPYVHAGQNYTWKYGLINNLLHPSCSKIAQG